MSEKSKKKKKSSAADGQALHDTTDVNTTSTCTTVLSTKSTEPKKKNAPAKLSGNQSSVFFGYDLPDDITGGDVLSFLREYEQVIVNVEIMYNRWHGNHAKIVFATPSDARAAIKQCNALYWEEFDICVIMKLWKGRDKDTTTCQKIEDLITSVKAVQYDGRKSNSNISSSSPSSVDLVGKPFRNESDMKPKRQAKQSHHSSSQSLNSDNSGRQYTKVYTIKLSGIGFNAAERKIEKLVKPFGDLANRVKILHYPGVCYAYVDYRQKSSAEEAVLWLDKSELDGNRIHVCHKGADHNCSRELKALNNPKRVTTDKNVFSATTSKSDTSDPKAGEHHEIEADETEIFSCEITNLSPGASTNTADRVKEMTSSDSSYRQKVYSVKLSGFRINIKGPDIEWLVRSFGDLTDPIEISHYPETNISYALVNYKQKNSAEKAVLELDRREFNSKTIHVCHQGELAVGHDCCSVLNALNALVVESDNLNSAICDLLDMLKTKSVNFINHLAVTNELDFKSPLRSVTVSSCDHDVAHELKDGHGTQNCTTLEVKNLHPDAWFQDLENHFKSCDSPLSVCLNYYAYSSSAFLCYASADVASNVMDRFDGSELNGNQIHVVKANYNIPKAKSLVNELSITRTGNEVATKPVQHAHTLKKETKNQGGISSKKRTASLKQYQTLVLMVCMPNLVKDVKTSWNVTVTGFHEGSTCLNFRGDNFQKAYRYVMRHVELCESKEFHCNMDSPLFAVAIKCIKKLRISVVICHTDGKCLPNLENVKGVYNDVVVIHSLDVKEIDHAISILQCSPHSRQLTLPSKDIKRQLKVRINEFQIKYIVSLQVLREGIIIQGYIEDDVVAAFEESKKLIDDLSQVTTEYNNYSREEIQFLRYVMFYKQTEQAKTLLAHLSESLSLKIQKTRTSFNLTGNPIAVTEGINIIEKQLLDNFQVETFKYRCHPDFLQLIKESVKEPVEKDLNVVIYYFSVNGSEQLEPVNSVVIYVKVYSIDSTDFKRARDILRKLKPQSHPFTLAEDEFEYIANTAEDTVDLTSIGEPFRVMIVLQHEKLDVTLHAFTLKEAKDCFHVLKQTILAALNLVRYIELTTLQMQYLCSNKSDLVKSLNIQFETSTKMKLEGKRSQVEKSAMNIQELLNRIVTKSYELTYNKYITMWKKCWQEIKDKILQNKELYVKLTTSESEESITCELVVVGEDVQKVENAISPVTKLDGKVKECNIFADAEGIEILSAALVGNKLNIKKEIAYHIEIVQTNIIVTTPYHMPVEQVKQTVEAYILSEKEKLKIVKKSFEIQYSFLTKKLYSEWNTVQSFANNCKVNLVADSRCAIEVEGKNIAVGQAEPQILEYILSLESDVNCSVVPVDCYSRPVLQSSELLHLCKEVQSKSCISLRIQVYPEVLSSAVVRWFNPSVTVQICEGSISLDSSDVFINFTDANLTMSEELRILVGDTAAVNSDRHVKYYGSQPAGKAVWYNIRSGGKKVIHAVIPNWVDGMSGEIDLITSAVVESLDLAVKHNATSVSLPFLSCIDKKFPVKFLAECCLLAVHSFCKRSNFIHRIRLVLPSEMVKVFVVEFTTGTFQHLLVANNDKACSVQGDSIWLWKDDLGEYQCYESGQIKILDRESKINPTCHLSIGRFTYNIDFSAMTQTNTSTQKVRSIKHVMSDCKWMFKNSTNGWEYFSLQDSMKIETKYINGTDFSMVIAGGRFVFNFSSLILVNTQTNDRTDIKRLSTNESMPSDETDSKITIVGLNADVEDAEIQLKSCIDSLCLVKSVNIPVSIVCTDLKKIERQHRVKICTTATSMRYNVKGFRDYVQEAVTAIYQTIAEKNVSQSLQYYSRPKEWEPQSDVIELMNVSKGSLEWNKILNRMQETLPTVKLTSIQRIQNENLWEKYCQHKERMGRKGSERVNEKELFHGTSKTPPEEIYKSEEGFDMRFSRSGMWGRGNYFAESAKYSASSYSYRKETTHTLLYLFSRTVSEKQIFLAKVLTGDSYRSPPDQTLQIPPLKITSSSSEKIRYDTVNGISHGGELIYIAYSNDKAYPMYLITFTDN